MQNLILIDILNSKAFKLLQDLESLQLIRIHEKQSQQLQKTDWITKYKGSMSKQNLSEIDDQLNELRNEWE